MQFTLIKEMTPNLTMYFCLCGFRGQKYLEMPLETAQHTVDYRNYSTEYIPPSTIG